MEIITIPAPESLAVEDRNKIIAAFADEIVKMQEYEAKFIELTSIDTEPTEEQMNEAKELRKLYVKTRTGTEKIHKTLKAASIDYGRYLDGWKSKQKEVCIGYESALLAIEEFELRKEAARLNQIKTDRMNELMLEGIDIQPPLDICTMDATAWKIWKTSATTIQAEQRKEAEEERNRIRNMQAENDRLRAEAFERARKDREAAEAQSRQEKASKDEMHRLFCEQEAFDDMRKQTNIAPIELKKLLGLIIEGKIQYVAMMY